MPIRPREINDQTTEARIREIIRHILQQEVRRLLEADASLITDVAANTSGVATNATNIAINVTDISNNARRAAARNNEGFVSSSALQLASGGVEVTEFSFSSQAEWSVSIASHPVQVTLWAKVGFTSDAAFDTFQFDAVQFDQGELEQKVDVTTQSSYVPSTGVFKIEWGSSKSGTLHLLNFGSGLAFGVVAVAD